MLRWPFKRKNQPETAAGRETSVREAPGNDWDFLRTQPDHDADEMATVHGPAASPPTSAAPSVDGDPAAWPPSQAPSSGDTLAWLRSRASDEDDEEAEDAAAVDEWPRHPHRDEPAAMRDMLGDLGISSGSACSAGAVSPHGGISGSLRLQITVAGRSRFQTIEGEALVGRNDPSRGVEPEVELSPDDGVSRRHALIVPSARGFTIQDLSSISGTRLNGRWLEPDAAVVLSPGDRIELGGASELLVADPAAEEGLTEEDLAISGLLQQAMGIPAAGAGESASQTGPWQPGRRAADLRGAASREQAPPRPAEWVPERAQAGRHA